MFKSILICMLLCLMIPSQAQLKNNKTPSDSSLFYLQQALKLSDTTQSVKLRHKALRRLGNDYFTKGNASQGKASYLQIIDELHNKGDKKSEVAVWEELSKLIYSRDTSEISTITCLKKIALLYGELGDKEKEIAALKNIADVHMNYGQLDTAEAELLHVLEAYKAINYRSLHYTYDLLSVIYRYKSDFKKALDYALQAVQSMESTHDHDSASAVVFYSRLANMYRELNDPQNSVKWYWKVFQNREYKGPINVYMFRDAGFLARELIKLNQPEEAIAFILDIGWSGRSITSLKTTCRS